MRSPEIVSIDVSHPDAQLLARGAEIILGGGLIVLPTETRYGLLTRADQRQSLDRLYAAKRRPATLPTALFVRDYEQLKLFGKTNDATDALAGVFLPGPLTLVMDTRADLPAPVVVDGKIGIRISSAACVDMLLSRLNVPVTATSANLSGEPENDNIDQISSAFGSEVGLYYNAGLLAGEPSTVVDCSGEEVVVLREGAISRGRISQIVGN
jgi:L-threonylcarbamoyladenylate synthase